MQGVPPGAHFGRGRQSANGDWKKEVSNQRAGALNSPFTNLSALGCDPGDGPYCAARDQ